MKKRLVVCILFVLLLAIPAAALAEPLVEARGLIQDRYVVNVSNDILNKASIEEMVKALDDPYSTYIAPEDFKEFLASLDGEYVGVGMYIEQVQGACQVVSPISGSPAEIAGVQAGDIIIKVDGKSVAGLSSAEVAGKIRGPEGTSVTVTVRRGSRSFTYRLTRQTIRISSVEYYKIGTEVGFVKLNGFNSESPAEMKKALDTLTNENVQKVVLDLRGNPGGLLDVAVSLAGEFVPKGPVVHVIQRGNKEYTLQSFKTPRGLSLAVLVDGGTASAGEILAGAIQDAKSGSLIGTKTFGKGSVQTIFNLSNGGGLKMTTAKYLTRDRHEVNLKGIMPDIVEADESKQMAAALKTLGDELDLYDLVVGLDSPLYFAGTESGSFTVNPYLQNGRVMVPLRSAAGLLGGAVTWQDGKAVVKTSGKTFTVIPGGKIWLRDSETVKSEMRRGQLMVPLRVLTDSLGLKSIWDRDTQSAVVTR